MLRLLLTTILFLFACHPATIHPLFIPKQQRVEEFRLPQDPSTMPVDKDLPQGEWIVPLEAGSCQNKLGVATTKQFPCPLDSGILYSEASAYRDGLYKISYKEIRKLYENDREVWKIQRSGYEEVIAEQNRRIESVKPTFLQKNALVIGFGSGFLLTTMVTVLLFTAIK